MLDNSSSVFLFLEVPQKNIYVYINKTNINVKNKVFFIYFLLSFEYINKVIISLKKENKNIICNI